jgi:hypothetical protein
MDRMKVPMTWIVLCLVMLVATAGHADGPLRRHAGRRLVPGLWLTEVAKLTASDAAPDDRFGALFASHQAILGGTLVVGSYLDDNEAGVDAGSAYVFEYVEGAWTEVQHFTGSDTEAGDAFGGRMAVSDDTVFIGAIWDDHSGHIDAGSVYVFDRTPGGLVQRQKLVAGIPTDSVSFGWSLAVDGDTLVVGSARWWAPDEIGTVHIFTRSLDVWNLAQVLTASDATPGDNFGHSVALSGDVLVVGAPQSDHSGTSLAGAAYVFQRAGDTWTEHQILTASDPVAWDGFGESVALSSDFILTGAAGTDRPGLPDSGAACLFESVGDVWVERQTLTASDGGPADFFGNPVNLAGDTAIVSAVDHDLPGLPNAGAAYVFARVGDTWHEMEKCTAADAAAGDEFGSGIAISGQTVVIGVPLDDHSAGTDAGSVYVFRLASFADGFESGDTSGWSTTLP